MGHPRQSAVRVGFTCCLWVGARFGQGALQGVIQGLLGGGIVFFRDRASYAIELELKQLFLKNCDQGLPPAGEFALLHPAASDPPESKSTNSEDASNCSEREPKHC